MIDSGLSSQQLEVIDALSSGATLTDAAGQAGVHRNTIAYWRRNSPSFLAAMAHAQYDRTLIFRERAEALADRAFQTFDDILADPSAPASVRLKAATFIIQQVVTPTPPKPEKPLTIHDPSTDPMDFDSTAGIDHESEEEEPEPAALAAGAYPRSTAHRNAQPHEPYRRPDPKIGRNEACPCGSGRKFKRCCLGKPLTTAA
jgi:hypothetical protein